MLYGKSQVEKALRKILNNVADPNMLGFIVEDGVVRISTQTDIDRQTLSTRVYDIRDLTVQIKDYKGERITNKFAQRASVGRAIRVSFVFPFF